MSENLQTQKITDEERRRRQKAADFARASVGLEGFKPSEEAEAQMRRHINGEISLADLVKPAR
ncbi:antitoxin VbhA family protein [Salmonella enterica subsp. enterica serovar Derby]|nr:antitoxin VbhA family protein [Salmonella enterica subsp. enterica serovar 4,[5],12:i:-]EKA8700451.1 antitoxin VbhA family protein [Salmonella enterica subsp. enterica serovar Derby]